jgi:WD40 repeat protein/tRNA A-37 threonylcarbamoyl transferase component Bud32
MTADQNLSFATGLAHLVDVLSQRLQDGEPLELSNVLRAHPEHAEELRKILPALGALNDYTSHQGNPNSAAPPLQPLGDFRLLREVGRGGMGVVYEAEQLSLRRKVALKVLPFAATLDPRQLQRFRHEAQAAALLHHPNVVPVHAVGCERGVHYYAMQFIEGRTLAKVVRDLLGEADFAPRGASTACTVAGSTSRPVAGEQHCRFAARLCAQAAEALEYAHQTGVIHRDIKPANLLLDERGELWVTDFGLALVRGHPELTVTGDLLGTLRYMSPEQALAKPGIVDHRTDVYSLGATLYELLTLEAAVPGDDRAAVLDRIANTDPLPPHRLNPAIPFELETIVLKAVTRSRDERYQSAREFAEDLRRFLDGRPIHARRATRLQRAQKWADRHRRLLVALVASVAFVTLGVVFGSVWYAGHQRDRAKEAARKEQEERRLKLDALLQSQQARLLVAQATRERAKPGYHNTYIADLDHAVGHPPDLSGIEEIDRRRYRHDYQLHLERVRRELLTGLGDPLGPGPVMTGGKIDWGSTGNTQPATSCTTPDGQWAAEWDSVAAEVKLVARDGGEVVRTPCPLGTVLDLKLSTAGRLLVAGCEKGFAVWDLPGLKVRVMSRGSPVRVVAIDPRARQIALLTDCAELWDVASNRRLREYPTSGRFHPTTLGFSVDGNYLFIQGEQPESWSLRDTPEKIHFDDHEGGVLAITFSPDGRYLATTARDRTIRLWDVEERKFVRMWGPAKPLVGALTFSQDGRHLAAGDAEGGVRLLDPVTGTESARDRVGGTIFRLQFTADGRRLLAAAGKTGLAAWSMPLLERIPADRPAKAETSVIDLADHPNGESLVYMTEQGEVYHRSSRGNVDQFLLNGLPWSTASLGFDAAGERLTLVGMRGLVVLDWRTGAGVETVPGLRISHSSNGRWAAVASGRSISVCDRPSGAIVFTLPPEEAEVLSLAYSPDRRRLAVGLSNGGVVVWDVERVIKRFEMLRLDPKQDVVHRESLFQIHPPPSAP